MGERRTLGVLQIVANVPSRELEQVRRRVHRVLVRLLLPKVGVLARHDVLLHDEALGREVGVRELGEHLGQQHGQLVVVAGEDEAEAGAAVVHAVVEAGTLGVVRELGELVGELLREDPCEHGGGRRVVRRRREQVDVHVRLRPAEGGVGLVPQPQPLVVAQQPREHGRRRRRRRVVGGGIVGGGGIGATLNTSFSRYEFDTAAAILIIIILIVMSMEYTSSFFRKWVQ